MRSASTLRRAGSTSRSSHASFRWLLVSLIPPAVFGCGVYTFTGGGGLPGHIETLAILPFENRTTQFTLTQELTQALSDDVPGRLGVNPADETTADAVLRGSIVRYSERAVNYQQQQNLDRAPLDVSQRRVEITISVELYDVREDRILWSSNSLSAIGEYVPESQTEDDGRRLAIENLVQAIIDGAQSQW